MALERIAQILRGKNVKPLTEMESAVKYAVENAGSGGGGSSLPEVTSDDNGDVLTVVEGAWAKAAPSGVGFDAVIRGEREDGGQTYTYSVVSGTYQAVKAKLSNSIPTIITDIYSEDTSEGITYSGFSNVWVSTAQLVQWEGGEFLSIAHDNSDYLYWLPDGTVTDQYPNIGE